MVILGLKFTGEIPFKDVYITGLIRDNEGQKMSKTKGNVLDPIDIIDGIDLDSLIAKRTAGLMQPQMAQKIAANTKKQFPNGIPAFGTDALRFTYCALASTTRDIRFDLARVEGYRNFCNKIWNATRYVLMNTENKTIDTNAKEFTLADKWIMSRLQETIQQAHQYFKEYRFDLLAQALYEFTWNEYCDWYLELSKPILADVGNPSQQNATRYTLIFVLEQILRLLHPLMPFITEEIWQRVAPLINKKINSIMLQEYPVVDINKIDQQAVIEINWLKEVITKLRNLRSEQNISPAKAVTLICREESIKSIEQDPARYDIYIRSLQWLRNHTSLISYLVKIDKLEYHDSTNPIILGSVAIIGDLHLLIPIDDIGAELERLNKEFEKLNKEHHKIADKLENKQYLEKAPQEIVEKEKQRYQEVVLAMNKIEDQREKLERLGTIRKL